MSPSPLVSSLFHRLSAAPDSPLLYQGNRIWTCGEVLQRAWGIASVLSPSTKSPGPHVAAIYGNPTLETIAAVYGVLLAGHAFSFFDHYLTLAKAEAYGRTLRPDWVLTGEQVDPGIARALSQGGGRQFTLEDLPAVAEPQTLLNVKTEQAAYVLFTSGSTGEPKAACVSHEAAWRAQQAYWKATNLSDTDLIANEVMPSFDVATFDLFGIARGASLVLPTIGAMAENGTAFRHHLSRTGSTTVFTVPSIAEGLFRDGTDPKLPRLRLFGSTGETVPGSLAERLCRALPNTQIINFFGMTEAPYILDSPITISGPELNSFPLPDDHVRLALRIENGKEWPVETAPAGSTGELVIAGPVLFNGYLDESRVALRRRQVEREAFGDYFEVTRERRLHYLGRRERFAQIWGVRVLLDNLEAILESHALVRRAVVMKCREGEQLAAVLELEPAPGALSSDGGESAFLAAVTEYARTELDRYEFPGRWHLVGAMPLTRTRKKDRWALAQRFKLQIGGQA